MNNVSIDEVLKRPLSSVENGSIKKNSSSNPSSKSSLSSSSSSSDNTIDSENPLKSGVMSKDTLATNNNHIADASNIEDGAGSEAETVVLPGKELETISSKKTIRHEGNGIASTNGDANRGQRASSSIAQNNASSSTTKTAKSKVQTQEGTSSTDKKNDKTNGTSTSSRNSPSTTTITTTTNTTASSSSVSAHDQTHDQQHNSRSRATSESTKSRSENTEAGKSNPSTTIPRKRKVSIDAIEDKSVKRRIKREDNDNASTTTDSKRHVSNARSESPSRQRTSTASSNSPNITKPRRKPPPPLVVGPAGRRKQSIDGDSNDSQSPKHSAHPKLSHATDSEMLKKRRDKNGRTRVARACAVNNLDEVREHLKDHPEELDEPDNAGNTPLQIASLEGSTDIVRLLLRKGCKVDTENCDKDSPLIDSVENSHLAVVKLLLEAGVNPRKLNAKGEEPSDLVDLDHDDGPAIKEELARYRVKYDSRRRQSTEKGPDTGRESVALRSPRGSPSLNARSPPPQTTRRRAGRSEATRHDLLWITATAENLINFAGKGDDQAIMHLLNMRPTSDVEAVLAAAKGGHDSCLNLLLAMGATDPDPAPLEDQKKGYNTPMLAAIGKGNVRVIELLLEQPGFDPTQRLYKNQTYHEIAEKRQGDGWRDEYRKLKAAYDEKMIRDGKKTSAKSSRTSSPKDLKKSQKDRSPSAAVARESSPSASRSSLSRKRISEHKPAKSRERPRDPDSDNRLDRKHLKVPRRESGEGSNAISDHETPPVEDRDRNSASDQESLPKPRKRLVSGRDMKQAQDKQRRNSFVSTISTSSAPDSVKAKSSPDDSTKTRRLEVDEKRERKRLRRSVSPQPSEATKSAASAPKRSQIASDATSSKAGTGSAQVASMSRTSQSGSSAPIALMSSSSSEKRDVKTGSKGQSSLTTSSKEKIIKNDPDERTKSRTKDKPKPDASIIDSDKKKTKEPKVREDLPQLTEIHEPENSSDAVNLSKIKQEIIESPTKASASETGVKTLASRSISPDTNSTAMATATLPAESAPLAEPDRVIPQPATTEDVSNEVQIERKRARDQEEAKAEAERTKRRLEDEEVSRRRAALELRLQQERELYLETLPPAFRRALENTDLSKSRENVGTWLPLICTTGIEIDSNCQESMQHELWLTNFQVAMLLAEPDLEMSHYTGWVRQPLVAPLEDIVWRRVRSMVHRWSILDSKDPHNPRSHTLENYDASVLCEKKFRAIKKFWIRLSDFESVVSRYAHLKGIDLVVSKLPTIASVQEHVRKIEEREAASTSTSPSPWSNALTYRTFAFQSNVPRVDGSNNPT